MLQPVSLRRATSGDASSTAPSLSARSQVSATASRTRGSVARAALLRVRPSAKGAAARTSPPLRAAPDGIAIGTAAAAAFHCFNDPMEQVAPEHGTLECTPKHGVWVYVDHSALGTTVNGTRRIQNEAVVVRSGDRLLVGNTEIELRFEAATHAAKEGELSAPHTGTSRLPQTPGGGGGHVGLAPSPIEWSGLAASSRADAVKSERERAKPLAAAKAFASATPPPHTASPAPGFNPRRKRHSMTAFTPSPAPPPPPLGTANSTHFMFQRTRPLIPSAPSTPPRADATRPHGGVNISPRQPLAPGRRRSNQSDDEGAEDAAAELSLSPSSRAAKPASRSSGAPPPPPPLGFSSSPVAGPTSQLSLRMGAPQIPQSPSPRLGPQRQAQQPPALQQRALGAADPPKSQRDDLRRRVLKKMELDHLQDNKRDGRPIPSGLQLPLSLTPRGAAQSTASASSSLSPGARRTATNNQLDFTPPSSPVAHKDILRQKESLLNILKSKYKEEQLLKQQQEEWMRHHFSLATPPRSPRTSNKSAGKTSNDDHDGDNGDNGDHDRDSGDDGDRSDLEIPLRAPVLLRTISLGIHQASPRLTAAVLASRARLGSSETKRSNQRSPRATAAAFCNASRDSAEFSSVSSSVSTELACHRRVTRSLSLSSKDDDDDDDDGNAAVAEVHDFMGYEDDDDASDGITSFTTHGFYSSDDCKSNPKELSGAATTKRLLFSSFYSAPPSTLSSSSSSSLVLTGSATADRFAVDIVTPREPEDDELLESPTRGSAAASAALRHKNRVDDTAASANLFDQTQRRPLYMPARSGLLRRSEAVSSSSSHITTD
ncbi:hypothetical protein PybrP1_010019 [[Pythium] brassicae (nom. inval.)]|nr:hypothetical protein PybrP1_010019 [[Pythium] brassicae (nom. inval.)]